jgi:arylsulfatase A-like enzyme
MVRHQRVELSDAELAHIVSLYDDDVADADESVGALLQELEDEGLRDHTLVALTGDHGEELYDHDFYFFHSWSIHDSVLRVPLVLRLPGRLPAGRELDGVVENIDIAPTLFALLDLEIPESFEGRNLEPDVSAPGPDEHVARTAFSELGPGIFSLRTPRWRYIYNPQGYSSPGGRARDAGQRGYFRIRDGQLYDVQADPLEQHDVAAEHPAVAAALRAQLLARIPAPETAPAAPIAPEMRRELRALGYLQELDESAAQPSR